MQWNVKKGSACAIIGARGGSKTIPLKNTVDIDGFPLIAYSIAAGLLTKGIDRVIVSTDDAAIVETAKRFGADAPFLRPKELAKDDSTDRSFLVHALEWLQEHEGSVPEYLVLLRPTSPLREPEVVAKALTLMKQTSDASGLRSAHSTDIIPHKMLLKQGKYFTGVIPGVEHAEDHTLPRQVFPQAYKADGYVDVLKSEYILEHEGRTYGDKMLAFTSPDTGDIDYQGDLDFVRTTLKNGTWEIYEYLKNLSA